jgi:hypothetical protein
MPAKPPLEFRLADRVRLRKVHPCGGWTWRVVRLGADIGLVCETCGRRVLLDRTTLERRVKTFLERGPDVEVSPLAPLDVAATADALTCDILGLRAEDVLEATDAHEVVTRFFYTNSFDTGSARLDPGDRVRVAVAPVRGETTVLVEPLNTAAFEQRFVPGGIRAQETYTGYAIVASCADLARHFRPVEATTQAERLVVSG